MFLHVIIIHSHVLSSFNITFTSIITSPFYTDHTRLTILQPPHALVAWYVKAVQLMLNTPRLVYYVVAPLEVS